MNARTALMRVELDQLRAAHREHIATIRAASIRMRQTSNERELVTIIASDVGLSNAVHDFLARADLIASEIP